MKKILVANRGEIALRIMRSIKEMDISTVAVFSEADRDAPFVAYADEAVCIGPAPSNQSYLRAEKIIEVCKALHVDGIHPGYGFLSENSTFAQLVEDNGITFIGPKPHSIETMGNKIAAKAAVEAYKIPMIPGTKEAISDIAEAKAIAEKIGFPILIKAAAGGGGKGMKIVEEASQFESQIQLAMGEAASSFGDDSVFMEKYIGSPRHIEVQVLGDKHGNFVHLYERDCSIQRRYQKVIEEAPSSLLSPEVREKIGKSAIDVARSCDYEGVGTVEFLMDGPNDYYFLEMNTRLQVEHPVTEMITGIDLVKEQIRVASGEKLRWTQNTVPLLGHSIEVRVYAEDASRNFAPDIGTLTTYTRPYGPGIRVDDGFRENMQVPIYYDPMISKLVSFASTREEAIAKMKLAVREYIISGVRTTLDFAQFALDHPNFVSGDFDTHFVAKHFTPEKLPVWDEEMEDVAALFGSFAFEQDIDLSKTEANEHSFQNHKSLWKTKRSR